MSNPLIRSRVSRAKAQREYENGPMARNHLRQRYAALSKADRERAEAEAWARRAAEHAKAMEKAQGDANDLR